MTAEAWDRRWRFALIALVVLAIGVHAGTLGNALTYDDHPAIEDNPLTLAPLDLGAHFSSGFWGPANEDRVASWRPLTTLTLAWNRAAHDLDPFGYHLVNLLLHALATLMMALLARALGLSRVGAIAAASLFAVHPVHVEAIAAGVGRADLLLGVLGLTSLYLWEKGRLVWAMVALAGALLSKEMAVTLLGVMAWRAFSPAREDQSDDAEAPYRIDMRAALRRVAWPLGLVVLYLVARYGALGSLSGAPPGFLQNPAAELGSGLKLLTAGEVYYQVLGLMTVPVTLLADYSYATVLPPLGPTATSVIGLAALLLTGAYMLKRWRSAPLMTYLLGLWFFPYLLVSHIGPTLPMIMAERVLYLPSAGLALLVGLGLTRLSDRPSVLRAAAWAVLCVVLAFSVRSAARVGDWQDDETLFLRTAADAPNGIKPLVNAAHVLKDKGEADKALALVERALALYEPALPAHLAAAGLHTEAGRKDRALSHIQRALELSKGAPEALVMHCAWAARFDPPQALERCPPATGAPRTALRAWMYLAMARDRTKDPAGAQAAFEKAHEHMLRPNVDLLFNHGVFLARYGRFDQATPLLQEAQRLAPQRAEIARALEGISRIRRGTP